MYKLVIAEKPSVAKSIAAVLSAKERQDGFLMGGDYIVSWCFGHLLGLAQADQYDEKYGKWRYADLPIIPDDWKHIAAKDKQKQLNLLSALMKRADVDTIINACDAGREGELIFRLVYEHCGCKKPIERLWISSMEDAAIRKGFDNLCPSKQYDNLYAAALCREKADWLVGINATRLFSVLYRQTLSVGRVQSPTLAMLVRREADIKAFVKEPFYTPTLDCGEITASADKLKEKQTAEAVRTDCDGQLAVITSVNRQEKTAAPPKLYDLTTLQREANRIFGYTAQQTLDYVQALYDKKLSTYPRTDSRYLTQDMAAVLPSLVSGVAALLPFIAGQEMSVNVSAVINDGKVTDHHAIIPTPTAVKSDLFSLPDGERNILNMLAVRLVCAVSASHIYAETTVTVECAGHSFTSKGKTVPSPGWKGIEQAFKATIKVVQTDNDGEDDTALPVLGEGQMFEKVRAAVKEGFTSPPKAYTEDTLLSSMESAAVEDMPQNAERKGLGTPATRAAIIEKLVKSEFINRRKQQLIPTEKGVNLITLLPDTVTSPALTAEWESKLGQIERGELIAEVFMDGIADMTRVLVNAHSTPKPEYANLFAPPKKTGEVVGVCPRCKGSVHEGKKGFFCEDKACGFALWRDNKFFAGKKKELTKPIAAALLKDGRAAVTGLQSEKTGKSYDAVVLLDDTGKYVNFKLEFERKGEIKDEK